MYEISCLHCWSKLKFTAAFFSCLSSGSSFSMDIIWMYVSLVSVSSLNLQRAIFRATESLTIDCHFIYILLHSWENVLYEDLKPKSLDPRITIQIVLVYQELGLASLSLSNKMVKCDVCDHANLQWHLQMFWLFPLSESHTIIEHDITCSPFATPASFSIDFAFQTAAMKVANGDHIIVKCFTIAIASWLPSTQIVNKSKLEL